MQEWGWDAIGSRWKRFRGSVEKTSGGGVSTLLGAFAGQGLGHRPHADVSGKIGQDSVHSPGIRAPTIAFLMVDPMDATALIDAMFGSVEDDESTVAEVKQALKADAELQDKLHRLSRNLQLLLDDGPDPVPPPDLASRTIALVAEYRRREAEQTQAAKDLIELKDDDTLKKQKRKKPSKLKGPHKPLSGHGGPVPSLDETIKELIPELPDYDGQASAASTVNAAVRRVMAERLAPVLNEKIHGTDQIPGMPHATLDQKKKLADWVSDQLEPLGLAVQCPNTRLPAQLKAGPGNRPGFGTFYFEVYIDGKRKTPTWSDTLPELVLIDATPSRESEVGMQESVKPKSSRGGHRR